jgi:primosomal protein N' (replication factor Y)
LKISGRDPEKTADTAEHLGEKGKRLIKESARFAGSIEFLGPIEAPLARIAQRHRWQILLKSRDSELLHRFLIRLALTDTGAAIARGVRVTVDIDPFFML